MRQRFHGFLQCQRRSIENPAQPLHALRDIRGKGTLAGRFKLPTEGSETQSSQRVAGGFERVCSPFQSVAIS